MRLRAPTHFFFFVSRFQSCGVFDWLWWKGDVYCWFLRAVLLTVCRRLSITVMLLEFHVFKIIFWHGWICSPFAHQTSELRHRYVTVGRHLSKGWGNRGSALPISWPASGRPARAESPSDSLLAVFSLLSLNFITLDPELIRTGRTFLGPALLMDFSIPSSLLNPARRPPPPCKSPGCVAVVW